MLIVKGLGVRKVRMDFIAVSHLRVVCLMKWVGGWE